MSRTSQEVFAARLTDKGKIADLTNGFALDNAKPFSVCVIPKANITAGVISQPDNIGLIIDCKLMLDGESGDFPVYFNQWSEALIYQIGADAIDLETYDVYWGCGDSGEEAY